MTCKLSPKQQEQCDSKVPAALRIPSALSSRSQSSFSSWWFSSSSRPSSEKPTPQISLLHRGVLFGEGPRDAVVVCQGRARASEEQRLLAGRVLAAVGRGGRDGRKALNISPLPLS